MALSFSQGVLMSKRPVVLFHTWTVTRELLTQAIAEKRSMDLDVCVDDRGNPYLGHSKEYHDKTYQPLFNSRSAPTDRRDDSRSAGSVLSAELLCSVFRRPRRFEA
jgi:hypothetical protein